jgi:hypothetical protein
LDVYALNIKKVMDHNARVGIMNGSSAAAAEGAYFLRPTAFLDLDRSQWPLYSTDGGARASPAASSFPSPPTQHVRRVQINRRERDAVLAPIMLESEEQAEVDAAAQLAALTVTTTSALVDLNALAVSQQRDIDWSINDETNWASNKNRRGKSCVTPAQYQGPTSTCTNTRATPPTLTLMLR